jgi:hypothetical protein
MKPNYKTSEFWFTVVSFIISGLYLIGLINDFDQKEELISDVTHGVESIILLFGQFGILYRYIQTRNEQKKSQADLELAKQVAKQVELELKKRKKEHNEQPRINNTGSPEIN